MGDSPELLFPDLLDPGYSSNRYNYSKNKDNRMSSSNRYTPTNLEQSTPLQEIGISDDTRDTRDTRDTKKIKSDEENESYEHQSHYKSGALWAYIIIALVTAVLLCYLLFNSNQDGWLDSLHMPGGLPFKFGLAVWVAFFVILVIVAYIGHQESYNDNKRMMLTWAFIIQFGLLLLWGVFFYGQHNPRVAFYILLLALLAAVWWAYIMWDINRGAALLIIVYILWLTYVTWTQWLVVSHNPDF